MVIELFFTDFCFGKTETGQADVEKAVSIFFNIANVKYQERKYEESLKFCERASKIGKEDVIYFDLMSKVLELKMNVMLRSKYEPATILLDAAEDFYNLKEKSRSQYMRCLQLLRSIERSYLESNQPVKLEKSKRSKYAHFS